MLLTANDLKFGDINVSQEKAGVFILPIPYEATTIYQHGTKLGPDAILRASAMVPDYDIELQKNTDKLGFFTLKPFIPSSHSIKDAMAEIEKTVNSTLHEINEKFLIILGGEHSISLGAIKSFHDKFKDLSVLQLDAHADLQDTLDETLFSHACVMRRVREEGIPITQVGIRSITEKESDYIDQENIGTIQYAPNFSIDKMLNSLSKNVYITIDMDVFDPSIVPSVGTPEPGGLTWQEVLSIIKAVAQSKKIVGVDIVELCPRQGEISSDYLAARLIYKIIGYYLFATH